jgi:hypothetical protein
VAGKRKIVFIFDTKSDMIECPDPSYWHDYFLGLVDKEIPEANDKLHKDLNKSGYPERVCG